MNSIEQLSNEIFYEIFDYLDGYDIHKAFSNLNTRFENLFINSSYLLKIRFSSESESIFEDRYKHIIDSNKYQIISLHSDDQSLINKFNTCTIDSSFNHLQSIILHEIATFQLMKVLFRLKSLPRLFSLTVFLYHCDNDLDDIYQTIFKLRVLKYFKLKILVDRVFHFNLSIPSDEQFSPLKYFVINHYISLNELTDLLCYTPELTHLYCSTVIQSEDNIKSEVLMKLNNLIHLTIFINYLTFDNFEEYFMKLSSQLRVLTVAINRIDKSYLDADRWEQLIVHHMPFLEKFDFCRAEYFDDEFQINSYHPLINRFISPFWINKNWIFMIMICYGLPLTLYLRSLYFFSFLSFRISHLISTNYFLCYSPSIISFLY
jgi:hypothetical protein